MATATAALSRTTTCEKHNRGYPQVFLSVPGAGNNCGIKWPQWAIRQTRRKTEPIRLFPDAARKGRPRW